MAGGISRVSKMKSPGSTRRGRTAGPPTCRAWERKGRRSGKEADAEWRMQSKKKTKSDVGTSQTKCRPSTAHTDMHTWWKLAHNPTAIQGLGVLLGRIHKDLPFPAGARTAQPILQSPTYTWVSPSHSSHLTWPLCLELENRD